MKSTSLKDAFFEKLGSIEQIFCLFDMAPGLSFFVKDRDGKFMALNQRGCEYCGVSSEDEALGRTDYDFFPRQRADEYRADDVAVMESGQPISNRVESAPEDAGSPRLVMTSKIPLKDSGSRVIGIAGFSRQIERIQTSSGTADAFAQVIEYLHSNYEEALSTEMLADMAGLSTGHFERRFRHAFGSSPHQYLVRIRIENAADMLRSSGDTISQIAQRCGFYDHAHLSRSFRRIMHQSPSEYRSEQQPSGWQSGPDTSAT